MTSESTIRLVCAVCGREHHGSLGALCPADGSALVTPQVLAELRRHPDPLIGRRIADRFSVVGLIGRGGFGSVYHAIQDPLGREVAL